MISSVSRLSLRFMKSNKFITSSCIITVMLAVSLIVTMFTFTFNINSSLLDDMQKENIASFQVYMIVLSVLVIIVTSILLISNFEVFMYKNRNQIAILRSIGASRIQIVTIIWNQCFTVNIIGSGLGILLAWASHQLVHQELGRLFSFSNSHVEFPLAIAIITTCISAGAILIGMFLPLYRGVNVLPLQIIQRNEEIEFTNKKIHWGLVDILFIGGILLLVVGYLIDFPFLILISALMIVIGFLGLLPRYIQFIFVKLAPIIKLLFGKESYVAVKNVIPQVKKNTFIIITISSLMMISVFGTAVLRTVQETTNNYIGDQFPTSIVITTSLTSESEINHIELSAMANQISNVQGVSTVSVAAEIRLARNGQPVVYQLVDLKEMEKQGLLQDVPDRIDHSIIIAKKFAQRSFLQEGESIELEYSDSLGKTHRETVIVSNIVDQIPGGYDACMDWNIFIRDLPNNVFHKAYVSSNMVEGTLSQLQELKETYPELQIVSYDQAIQNNERMFYQRWSVFIVSLIVILLCVILGVFNTLINHIYSKRKEFAILRAISINRKGIRKIIVTQVILFISVGLIQGIVLGILLMYILNLIGQGMVYFDISTVLLIGFVVLAAAWPVFTILGHRIGGRNVTLELTEDHH